MKRNSISRTTIISLFICIMVFSIIGFFRIEIGSVKSGSGFFFTITTYYHGINASEIERVITIPMEESISLVNGISALTSRSSFGESRIFIRIEAGRDHGDMYLNIRDRVDIVYQNMPRAVQKPQIYSSSSESKPSFVIAFNSEEIELSTLRNHIEEQIKPRFDQLDNTGLIEIAGGGKREIHVKLDPQKAAKWNVTINQIASFLQQSHLYHPIGYIKNGAKETPVIVNSRLTNLQDVQNLSVRIGNLILPLKEIAQVEYAYRSPAAISRVNGDKRVVLYIHSTGEANLISLSNNISSILHSLDKKGYTFDVIYNEGEVFQKKLNELFIILIIELVLVFLVLFILGSKKQIVLIILSIPLILFITAAVLSFLHIPIDRYVLSGLALGIGLMADTGIILTGFFEKENNSSLTRTITALIGSTLTTIIVLIPTLFMESVIPGIREITISLASLSIVTLLFNILFIPAFYTKHEHKNIELGIERNIYKTAGFFMRFPKWIIAIHFVILLSTIAILFIMNKDFDRTADRGTLFIQFEFPSGYSPAAVDREITSWQKRITQPEGILVWETKANRGNAQSTIRFDPATLKKQQLIQSLENQKELLPYGELHIRKPGEEPGFRIQVHISGNDIFTLQELCNTAVTRFQEMPWAHSAVLHFKENPPAVVYHPQTDILNTARQSAKSIGSIMKWYIQGPVAVKIPTDENEMDLRIMSNESHIKSIEDIDLIPISVNNSITPLSTIFTNNITNEPSTIIRRNKQRSHSFSFTADIKDLDKAIRDVQTILSKITVPPGYFFEMDRSLIKEKENIENIFIALIISLLFVYLLLGALMESFKTPLLIISILPATMFIPLLVLIVTNISLNVSVIVGFILLCGISVNNSILLAEGMEPTGTNTQMTTKETVLQSIQNRIPALLTTTLTTVLASMPLAIMSFRDLSFSNILAIVVFFGMISSFIATIVLIPVVLDKFYR